jgi:hypothetical protein
MKAEVVKATEASCLVNVPEIGWHSEYRLDSFSVLIL